MRKNYSSINKVAGFVLAMAMTLGFTSCEDILGHWDNPAGQEVIETIVSVTGATTEEITALVEAAMTDAAIQKALATGEPIKIEVAGGSTTSSSNHVITIPMTTASGANKVEVELNFSETISTSDDNPLEFKAATGADNPSAEESDNELTVSMPDVSGLVISIELPNTTVTLTTNGTSTVYKSVAAKTAKQTLVISKGVTVEDVRVDGGTVRVEEGGTVKTYVYPAGRVNAFYFPDEREEEFNGVNNMIYAWDEGVAPAYSKTEDEDGYLYKYELCTDKTGQTPYFTKNLKITPGDGSYARVAFWNEIYRWEQIGNWLYPVLDHQNPLEKFIIADGAKAIVEWHTIAKELIGEGVSEIKIKGEADVYDAENHRRILPGIGVECAEKISNIIFSNPHNRMADGEYPEEYNGEPFPDDLKEAFSNAPIYTILGNFPTDVDHCTFESNEVIFGTWENGIVRLGDPMPRNCTFKDDRIAIYVPRDVSTFDFSFDNCTFKEGCKIELESVMDPDNNDVCFEYSNVAITLNFTNCGSKDEIESRLNLDSMEGLKWKPDPEDEDNYVSTNVTIIININGTKYGIIYDDDAGKHKLNILTT